ncbi:chemotaxis protein CheW [Pseudomonas oryzihabitans]|uniref:Purine-binding chemotaxis protein CheW n=1 Tax=Pseudomonas oryzihabitans TaxID=47885 RepID=A0AAJ2BDW3_9PSED|nr:chemotaxis protein CheW [Pseudomonas psychrotolerans]MDR6232471.1 purine-binding chemotaxis protein CheW [Pseudomonas psychrotolerans]
MSLAQGVVRIGTLEVAIPAQALERVVSWPERLAPHPSAAPWLLGLFELSGRPLPLVDGHALLGLPVPDTPRSVAVIHHGGGRFGLGIDGVVDILTLADEVIDRLQGTADRLLGRIHLEPRTGRLVHLLDLELLVTQPGFELSADSPRDRRELAGAGNGQERLYLLFECDGRRLCLDAAVVQELVDRPQLTASEFASDACRHEVQLRGQTLPVLELSGLLGLASPVSGGRQHLLVLAAGAQGEYRVAFGFERLLGMWRRDPAHCTPLLGFGLAQPELLRGVFADPEGESAVVIDHRALGCLEVTVAYARIYRTDRNLLVEQHRQGQRQPCLAFLAGLLFAVPLEQVAEVLPLPARYLRLGQADSRLLGLMEVRGQQITLICLRTLAGEQGVESAASDQVIVVQGQQRRLGFVVQQVDAIDTFTGLREDALERSWKPPLDGGVVPAQRAQSWVGIGSPGNSRQATLIDLAGLVRRLEEGARQATSSLVVAP